MDPNRATPFAYASHPTASCRMGLLDWFRRSNAKTSARLDRIDQLLEDVKTALPQQRDDVPTKQDWLRIGRLEASVESLEVKWDVYREEMRKLVQRLEKREQRAEAKEIAAEVAAQETNGDPVDPVVDPITQQVLARRRRAGGIHLTRKEE